MKKCFVLILAILMLFSACAKESPQNETLKYSDENSESEIVLPAAEPIVYSSEDILEDGSFDNEIVRYYSIHPFEVIREIIPHNPNAEFSEDGYIGGNILYYYDEEILRTPVYFMGEPPGVSDVSLGRVQWLDGENAMIDGRFVFDTKTKEKHEFNPYWENTLNYALNKNKDKLAVSFLDYEDEKSVYRLSLYDFATGEWETLFEGENEQTYYFGAKLIWRNDNEIIFSAGIKREMGTTLAPEQLDLYSFNLDNRKCMLLMKGADLICNTGSFAKDRIFCSKYIFDEYEFLQWEIWVYDFKKDSASRIYESGVNKFFWFPQRGLFGFYNRDEKSVDLHCDETDALLGKIDLTDVMQNSNSDPILDIDDNYIKIQVIGEENGRTLSPYKVNISNIRERNYYFINSLYVGFTERSEFFNRTQYENVYGEFLSQEWFDIYSQEGVVNRSTIAQFDIMPGLDNFFEEKDAALLAECASEKILNDQAGIYNLPVKMSKEAYNVPISKYNGYIDFGDGTLATNAKHNLLPRKVEKVEGNEVDAEIIKKELEKDGITKAPVDLTEVFLCDLDDDGVDERVVFANSSDERFVREADSGNYTMVFVVRESGAELLYKETSRYGETIPNLENGDNYFDHWTNYCSSAGLYDLNADGKFEICIECAQYEHGRYMVFSENEDGKYALVLNSECGN